MTKKIDKISGYDRSLLHKLNNVRGFFLYGNRIRFTTNLNVNTSILIRCLAERPGTVIEDIVEDSIGYLSSILNWDGNQEFWFEPDELLLSLASQYRFYDKEEAIQHNIKYKEILDYPFVILLETPVDEEYDIPILIQDNEIWIGKGSQAILRSHQEIPKTVLKVLKKIPTKIQS